MLTIYLFTNIVGLTELLKLEFSCLQQQPGASRTNYI